MTVELSSLRWSKYKSLNEQHDKAFKAEAQQRHTTGVAAAQSGFWSTEQEGALIVSLLTQCLVQFCHLWMVPARCLGLMAEKIK